MKKKIVLICFAFIICLAGNPAGNVCATMSDKTEEIKDDGTQIPEEDDSVQVEEPTGAGGTGGQTSGGTTGGQTSGGTAGGRHWLWRQQWDRKYRRTAEYGQRCVYSRYFQESSGYKRKVKQCRKGKRVIAI